MNPILIVRSTPHGPHPDLIDYALILTVIMSVIVYSIKYCGDRSEG